MALLLDHFGFTDDEVLEARERARNYLLETKTELALNIFASLAPNAEKQSRDALHDAWFYLLSETGRANAVMLGGDSNPHLARFRGYLDQCLKDPILWCDPASWALFFAAKAFPLIHEIYPAAWKKFRHSSGVKRSQISPMASMS